MTIYQARDRQGVKYFSNRPEFVMGHDYYTGTMCRKPRKGDRIIKKFKLVLTGSEALRPYYESIKKLRQNNRNKMIKNVLLSIFAFVVIFFVLIFWFIPVLIYWEIATRFLSKIPDIDNNAV